MQYSGIFGYGQFDAVIYTCYNYYDYLNPKVCEQKRVNGMQARIRERIGDITFKAFGETNILVRGIPLCLLITVGIVGTATWLSWGWLTDFTQSGIATAVAVGVIVLIAIVLFGVITWEFYNLVESLIDMGEEAKFMRKSEESNARWAQLQKERDEEARQQPNQTSD